MASADDGGGKDDKPQGDGPEDDQDKKPDGDGKPAKKKPLWPWLVGAAVLLIFIGIVLYIIFAPHPRQTTNDAYVMAHFAAVAPRVPGQVTQVLVDDNQPVRAGQLLVTLDERDFRAALDQALASLAIDRARVAEAAAEVRRQPPVIAQAQSQVASASARLGLSQTDARRYSNLASTGAGTAQQAQQAGVARDQDLASLASANAGREAQVRQLEALQAALSGARAKVQADEAQVAQARLNLSYTRISAPIDGVVDQRAVQVGNYVAPGAPVMVVVPLESIYVLANYRELALRHMRPGQHVRIHVDAYDIYLDGVVDSLPGASGSSFSPIPPNNATGNFTKIVQRLPVKIDFTPGQRLVNLVRVGMSVETSVDTHLENVVAEQRRADRRVTGWP
jgi:membrane fusion protein (multidrug efflux system)